MSFGEAVRAVLHRWSDFGGRSSRSEFWFWWLATLLLYVVLYGVAAVADRVAGLVGLVILVSYVVLLVPTLSVFVRRLHDAGRSGWWWLLAFIPVGGLVLLIFLCLDSTPGPNAFGAPPRGSSYEHPSTSHTYLAGPQPGWGTPGNQQPGWGAPPPPPGPPAGWGAASTTPPSPRPGMTPPPSGTPVPAWQQQSASPPAPTTPASWQQPPAPAPQTGPVTPGADPWDPKTTACRTCGQTLTADAAFCSRCGRPTAG